jgi:hypothetical protein
MMLSSLMRSRMASSMKVSAMCDGSATRWSDGCSLLGPL